MPLECEGLAQEVGLVEIIMRNGKDCPQCNRRFSSVRFNLALSITLTWQDHYINYRRLSSYALNACGTNPT